jgi:hypothetical protein
VEVFRAGRANRAGLNARMARHVERDGCGERDRLAWNRTCRAGYSRIARQAEAFCSPKVFDRGGITEGSIALGRLVRNHSRFRGTEALPYDRG